MVEVIFDTEIINIAASFTLIFTVNITGRSLPVSDR